MLRAFEVIKSPAIGLDLSVIQALQTPPFTALLQFLILNSKRRHSIELITLILTNTIICDAGEFQSMLRAFKVVKSPAMGLDPSTIKPLQTPPFTALFFYFLFPSHRPQLQHPVRLINGRNENKQTNESQHQKRAEQGPRLMQFHREMNDKIMKNARSCYRQSCRFSFDFDCRNFLPPNSNELDNKRCCDVNQKRNRFLFFFFFFFFFLSCCHLLPPPSSSSFKSDCSFSDQTTMNSTAI